MADGKEKKAARRIGRPQPVLFGLACLLMWAVYKIKYHLRFTGKDAVRNMKGPALVLCQHLSNQDFILAALTLFPHRPTFVASSHFLQKKIMRWAFRVMHVITKKMFSGDAVAILKMLRARNENNIIVMFPEGRLPANGISVPVTAGTAELAKKLGIDVYLLRPRGAYLTFPKWSRAKRRGRIEVDTERLLTAEEVKNLSVAELEARLQRSFRYNDEQVMSAFAYRSDKMAQGAEGILWRCPSCGQIGRIHTEGNRIMCDCGMVCTLDRYYRLSGCRFTTITDWYRWQRREDFACDDPRLDAKARIGTLAKDGTLIPDAGTATIHLDREWFTLEGEILGEHVSIRQPCKQIGGFPITVHQHFDLYDHNGRLLYIYPQPDENSSMRWVAFLDYVHEQEDQAK
ncbi:MAG: 1-acyl-sn-glycerol-3-phosphate acyltransferase [Clostridia bacterium]|nr:1-acyl-sn-glycerol-3-phosphate acyltransferase [Clostridia bacterium]